MDTATKIGLDALKTALAEATGEFTVNKVTEKIMKSDLNSRNVEEIVIQLEKREKILNELRQVLQNLSTIKYVNY